MIAKLRAHPRAALAAFATLVLAGGASLTTASCAQTPPNVPVRSFDRAQKVDVVCLHVEHYDPNTGLVTEVYPQPLPEAQCQPTPIDVNGTLEENHLFALVTQATRGEVAVVDLSAGNVVDIDNSTPGINFLPVGKNPTDIAAAPDGTFSFVASAEVGKPAIYALDSRVILGDSRGLGFDPSSTPPGAPTALQVPTLTTWPACSLPQTPGAMTVVPAQSNAAPTSDAGTSDAGDDAGASDAGAAAPGASSYSLAVVLPGDEVNTAKLVTLDPAQFTDGSVPPGSLAPCRISSAIELSGASAQTWSPGPAWSDGLPYDGSAPQPPSTTIVHDETPDGGDAGFHEEQTGTAGVGVPPVAASCPNTDGGIDDAGVNALPALPPASPRGGFVVRDGTTLYVADLALPLVHVIDLSDPAAPKELAPLVASSILEPSRRVTIGQMALSPPTRDYKRYLYAIDQKEGSIIVYDVSDPVASPHVPMTRPHPELNPFQAPDRISFSSPVASLAFASHDFSPLTGTALPRGVLCNPNLNAGLDLPPIDPGAWYRANVASSNLEGNLIIGPSRLRGVFAFATLSNGAVVLIDVDDWDSPCRRPDPMTLTDKTGNADAVSSITPNEPPASSKQDLDPYHSPNGTTCNPTTASCDPTALFSYTSNPSSGTTEEPFFPVTAPNRTRSLYLVRKDATTGAHSPNVAQPPSLFATLTTPVTIDDNAPRMMPTFSQLMDTSYYATPDSPDTQGRGPTLPDGAGSPNDPNLSNPNFVKQTGVRLSWEDPTVFFEQDWTVTYEGILPDFAGTPNQNGLSGKLTTTDHYQSLVLDAPNPLFCRKGIEDAQVGAERANAFDAALPPYGIAPPTRLDHRVGDYLQLSEDLLPPNDPYWSEDDSSDPNGTCWDFDGPPHTDPGDRYNTCQNIYGNAGDQHIARDFPIWQAFDDHLVVTRYGYTDETQNPSTREIVGPDPSNAAALKAMRCCFHRQVQFHVRTGGAWLALGGVNGGLNHITKGDGGACVQSCEPREQLLNDRSISIPRVGYNNANPPDRNSPLALRNPMFSYLIWDGIAGGVDLLPARDMVWKFHLGGSFQPYVINYAGSSTAAVSPQSMLFLDSFRRIAIVDGSAAGLTLIDLDSLLVNGGPYY